MNVMRFAVCGDFGRVNGHILVWLCYLLDFVSIVVCFNSVSVAPLIILHGCRWLSVRVQSLGGQSCGESHGRYGRKFASLGNREVRGGAKGVK